MRPAVDQLVFGYRDGHELLASSVEIDSRLEPRLLPHTDARFEDDAPHYLVGTPVRELSRFLLAQIWPAPEVSRPGAVWAHGLLLEASTLAAVDLVGLARLFRRPDPSDLSSYTRPLELEDGSPTAVTVPDRLLLSLCWATYAESRRGAVVIWEGAAEAEEALLAVWRAQPGSTRAKFSFRTRGRARTGESPYQIQVASTLGGRSGSDSVAVLDARRVASAEVPSWVQLIADSTRDPRSEFGIFVDLNATSRRSAVDLARLWPMIRTSPAPETAARFLEERFPKPSAMRRLKAELFGTERSHSDLWDAPEIDRVAALLEVGTAAFHGKDLQLPQRIDRLWAGERKSMLRLLDGRENLAPEALDLIVDSAAEHLQPLEVAERAHDRRVVEAIASTRPAIFGAPELWRVLPAPESERTLALAAASVGHRELSVALLAAGSDRLLNLAQNHGVKPLVVADALAREAPQDLSRWPAAFAGHEGDLGAALAGASRVRAETMLLVVAALPLAQTELVSLSRWLSASRVAHDRVDLPARAAATKLLVKALRADGETARKLLIECFGPVHAALEDGTLDAEAWAELDRTLPEPKSEPPKRLRRALVDNMERNEWRPHDLTRALEPAGPQARRLVKLVGKKHPLRRLVESAVEELVSPLGR